MSRIEIDFLPRPPKFTTLADLKVGEMFRFENHSEDLRLMVKLPDRNDGSWFRILNWSGFCDAGADSKTLVVRVELESATVREIE